MSHFLTDPNGTINPDILDFSNISQIETLRDAYGPKVFNVNLFEQIIWLIGNLAAHTDRTRLDTMEKSQIDKCLYLIAVRYSN